MFRRLSLFVALVMISSGIQSVAWADPTVSPPPASPSSTATTSAPSGTPSTSVEPTATTGSASPAPSVAASTAKPSSVSAAPARTSTTASVKVAALAVLGSGTVGSWGINEEGELGNGTLTDSPWPVHVSALTGVAAIAGADSGGYALRNDGTVWAWGYNNYGQLGNGTTTTSRVPVQVSGLSGATAVAAATGTPPGTRCVRMAPSGRGATTAKASWATTPRRTATCPFR